MHVLSFLVFLVFLVSLVFGAGLPVWSRVGLFPAYYDDSTGKFVSKAEIKGVCVPGTMDTLDDSFFVTPQGIVVCERAKLMRFALVMTCVSGISLLCV